MTEEQILLWIKSNLGSTIRTVIISGKEKNPALIYTEDWLAAICMRETGGKIAQLLARYPSVSSGQQLPTIAPLMRGDFGRRPHDTEDKYHGYGFTQIDCDSFPEFVNSGNWKDPLKTFALSVAILEEDRRFLQTHFPDLTAEDLGRGITAAYNCGAGNVRAVLNEKHDIDIRTTDKNYSAEVWRFREMYKTL